MGWCQAFDFDAHKRTAFRAELLLGQRTPTVSLARGGNLHEVKIPLPAAKGTPDHALVPDEARMAGIPLEGNDAIDIQVG